MLYFHVQRFPLIFSKSCFFYFLFSISTHKKSDYLLPRQLLFFTTVSYVFLGNSSISISSPDSNCFPKSSRTTSDFVFCRKRLLFLYYCSDNGCYLFLPKQCLFFMFTQAMFVLYFISFKCHFLYLPRIRSFLW